MIVIPMAGRSKRFFDEGFKVPKYQLPLLGETVFYHCLNSFRRLFSKEHFLFIYRPEFCAEEFISNEARHLGILSFELVKLTDFTSGQAETVSLGCRSVPSEYPLTIFNIDTIRLEFDYPNWMDRCDGYLEVFRAEGEQWSFIEAGADHSVLRTTEKEKISDLCSNGLYHFRRKSFFDRAFSSALSAGKSVNGEFYVAPLYNEMIRSAETVFYSEVERRLIFHCGTPADYRALLSGSVDTSLITKAK